MNRTYFSDWGGLPAQRNIIAGRAVFTEAYAFMPRQVQSDITASLLPGWEDTRAWILARPLTGFAETFAE
ncbi:MAG: (S)-ureidoglycine aminohydrolase, partial [Pseudooceanicola nanhaiensis]